MNSSNIRSLDPRIVTLWCNGCYMIGDAFLVAEVDDQPSPTDYTKYFGLGGDYIDTYADRIRAVSLEDVRQAARKHLAPEDLIVVVVGPVDRLDEQGLSDKRPNGSRTAMDAPKIP